MVQGSMSCIKYLMFIFNFIFVVCGIVLIAIGGVAHNKDYTVFLDSKFVTAPTLIIVVGVIIFLLAFLGCCGAIKENSCMVYTFGALLFLIFVIEIAGAGTAYAYKGKFEDFLKTNMNNSIKQQKKDATTVWDRMQSEWKCCGVDSYKDYTVAGFEIPKTCCEAGTDKCEENKVFKTGCYTRLFDEIKGNIATVGGVAIGIAVVELIGVMFAWCLASAIKRDYRGV